MLIKFLLLVGVAVVVALAVRDPGGARHQALRRIAILGFAVLAVLSVLVPDAWNAAAAVVGVGRGTDLLLYGFIVVFLVYMVTTYRRHRETEVRLTLLARRIAVDEAFAALGTAPTLPPEVPPALAGPDDTRASVQDRLQGPPRTPAQDPAHEGGRRDTPGGRR